jgi:prephenate dehydrogenase
MLPLAGVKPASQAPLVFERIAIVGLGHIGGSIALAARLAWPTALVIGVDRNDVLEGAIRLHAVDVAAEHLSIISEADLVVLACSAEQSLARLEELAGHLERDAVVTDIGRAKGDIMRVARRLPPHLSFVGGYPLVEAGGGISSAHADLFVGRPWILTSPDTGWPSPALPRFEAFVVALGGHPRVIDPSEYDKMIAALGE